MNHRTSKDKEIWTSIIQWFDSEAGISAVVDTSEKKVDWPRIVPFIVLHLLCLGVFWVGWSPAAVIAAILAYMVRMFAITGFYHRYFSHKAFKTNRFWQFVFAFIGNTSVQRGPLWWAAHHRHHHRNADRKNDVHSPKQHGFWWSHIGWLTARANFPTNYKYVKEWERFPELKWLNRFDIVAPLVYAASLLLLGELLRRYAPGLGTDGPQLFIWGFAISTVILLHATLTINSIDHMFGKRRYNTDDTSCNNAILAMITLGEGWHNNHHHYAVCARQGFYWWEVDITYYTLKLFSMLGMVSDLRGLPEHVKNRNRCN